MNVELEVFKVGPHTLVVLSNGQLLYGPKIICEFQHFQIDYESMGEGIMTTYSKTQILLLYWNVYLRPPTIAMTSSHVVSL